jgi:hypothetical protein
MRLYTAQITIQSNKTGGVSELKPEFILLGDEENVFDSLGLLYDKSKFKLMDYRVQEETLYKSKKIFAG